MTLALDHVIVAVRSLEEGIDWFESHSGVRPVRGGSHRGLGTHNAVVSLGESVYLELLAIDPSQQISNAFVERLTAIERPTGYGWCFRTADAGAVAAELRAAGVDLNQAHVRRTTPDGVELEWDLVLPVHSLGGAVPFLIDWGSTPSPARTAPRAGELVEAIPIHPEPALAQQLLGSLGVPATVVAGERSGIRLRIATPAGEVEVGP